MLRRRFLHGALASAGVLGLGAALDSGIAADVFGRSRVTLGYVGNPCEAATFAAPTSPIFHRHRLEARLVPFRSDETLIAAIAAGNVDAASVTLPAILKPLENDSAIRVVAGLHAGCLRVVAPAFVASRTTRDLKGATIATDVLHGPSMNLLSALLRRQGIDPQRDVAWHAYALADLETALDSNVVSCVAAADPLGYSLLADRKAEPLRATSNAGFSCGAGIGGSHHCFLALSGRLVATRPSLAADVTRAYLDASQAFGRAAGPAALATVRSGYTSADLATTIGILASYDWTPSTDFVLEELELTAHDFRRAGLLRRTTDPQRLADRAFADVLHA